MEGVPSSGVRRNGCWTPPPKNGEGVGPTTTTCLFGEGYRSVSGDQQFSSLTMWTILTHGGVVPDRGVLEFV